MSTSKQRVSHKVSTFTESVIREMTRLALDHNAINLAQGFPNFPAPQSIKDAACQAIQDDINQYAITWGAPGFRAAIAEKYQTFYGWEIDPNREITVACGSTESMISSILGLVDPEDRILVFEPGIEYRVHAARARDPAVLRSEIPHPEQVEHFNKRGI